EDRAGTIVFSQDPQARALLDTKCGGREGEIPREVVKLYFFVCHCALSHRVAIGGLVRRRPRRADVLRGGPLQVNCALDRLDGEAPRGVTLAPEHVGNLDASEGSLGRARRDPAGRDDALRGGGRSTLPDRRVAVLAILAESSRR